MLLGTASTAAGQVTLAGGLHATTRRSCGETPIAGLTGHAEYTHVRMMSNRTLVELEDRFLVSPETWRTLLSWAKAMGAYYMTTGDKRNLPRGVTFKARRHRTNLIRWKSAAIRHERRQDSKSGAEPAQKTEIEVAARHLGQSGIELRVGCCAEGRARGAGGDT